MIENIAKWIQTNPYVVIIIFIITILGFAFTVYSAFKKSMKKISFYYSTDMLIDNNISKIKDIEISYKTEKVNRFTVTSFKIWNSGDGVIEESNFYKGNHLSISCKDDSDILDAQVIKESHEVNNFSLKLIDNKIMIYFDAIEANEGCTINIYHTGNQKTEFFLNGKIKEGKIINRLADEYFIKDVMIDVLDNYFFIFPLKRVIKRKR